MCRYDCIKYTIISYIYIWTYRKHTSFRDELIGNIHHFRDVLWLIGPRFVYCHVWFSEPVPLINAHRGVSGFTMPRDNEYGMVWERTNSDSETRGIKKYALYYIQLPISPYQSLWIIINHYWSFDIAIIPLSALQISIMKPDLTWYSHLADEPWKIPLSPPIMLVGRAPHHGLMEVMLPLETMAKDNATSHLWTRDWPTPRLLQTLWLPPEWWHCGCHQKKPQRTMWDPTWMKELYTRRLQQGISIQCFSGVMAVRLLSDCREALYAKLPQTFVGPTFRYRTLRTYLLPWQQPCTNLVVAGEECCRLTAQGIDSAWERHKRIARELKMNLWNLYLVLPDGQLMAKICRTNPVASVANVIQSNSHSFWSTHTHALTLTYSF